MANTSISNLAAGAAVSATDVLPNVQTAGVGPVKTTAAQLKTYTSASPTLTTPAVTGGITLNGSTSGSIALSSGATPTAYTITFPSVVAGTNGSFLTSTTGGITSWTATLPIANGGTNNSSAYTAGSVIFSNGTALTQNNASLFWDNTNSRLGISTTTPNNQLQIYSGAGASNIRVGIEAFNAYYDFGRDASDGLFNINGGQTNAVGYKWLINGAEVARISNIGYLGVGVTPTSFLHVAGPGAFKAPNTQTGNYSMVAADHSVIFNGSGSITFTLQAASSYVGRMLYVKTVAAQTVISASSNVVPLAGGAAGTAILAATAGKWAILQSDGTNWIIMASN